MNQAVASFRKKIAHSDAVSYFNSTPGYPGMNKSLLFPWILPFFPGIFVGHFLTASAERRAVRRDWRAALHPVDLRHPGFGDVPTRHDAGHDLVICSTGIPKNGWFMSEHPMKMDDLEVPPCQGTSIWGVLSKIVI